MNSSHRSVGTFTAKLRLRCEAFFDGADEPGSPSATTSKGLPSPRIRMSWKRRDGSHEALVRSHVALDAPFGKGKLAPKPGQEFAVLNPRAPLCDLLDSPESPRRTAQACRAPAAQRTQLCPQSWSRKFGQRDRWSFRLMAGTLCPSNQERL